MEGDDRLKARFYIDPVTGSPHIHNHQVGDDEVIEVLEKPGEDRPGREGSRVALGRTLAGAFDSLDGVGLDFRLSGSAPVIDLDGDGRADALGNTGIAGGPAVGPGLWSATIEARAGTHVTYGSWLATRDPASR